MRRIRKNSIYDVYCICRFISVIFKQSYFGIVSIAQLVEVADSAVLGDVVEVVSLIPTVGHKNLPHLPA